MVLLDHGGACDARDARIAAAPADLTGLVEHAWSQRMHAPRDWTVVPDVSPHLIYSVVELESGPEGRLMAVGARSVAATIDVAARRLTIGVRLRPGALHALAGVHARALTDAAVQADRLLPPWALRDLGVSADAPPDDLVADLLQIVRRLACRTASRDLSVPAARSTDRTARERSSRILGLSPVRRRRIERLHRALWRRRASADNWASIAAGSGFADQAHLTREFRALLGESPTQWVGRAVAVPFKTAHGAAR